MQPLSDAQAWIGLAIAVLVLSKVRGLSEPLRLSLILVIAYVLLTNADRLAPQVERFTGSLGSAARPGPNPR